MSDKLPPNSPEAEAGVLGCILLETATKIDEAISMGLTGEHFYDLRHAYLWKVILDLHREGKPVDMVLLITRLEDQGRIEFAGGTEHLMSLGANVPSSAMLRYYFDELREKLVARKGLALFRTTAQELRSGERRPLEILTEMHGKLLGIVGSGEQREVGLVDAVIEATDYLEMRLNNQVGLKTGYLDLDKHTLGFQPGETWIIGGRPSSGKTALALGIARRCAELLKKAAAGCVTVFSLEMRRVALLSRMFHTEARVNAKQGYTSQAEQEALGRAMEHVAALEKHLHIDDTPGVTVSQLVARAKRYIATKDTRLFIIDYLQYVNPDSGMRARDRREVVDAVSRGVSNLAKSTGIPVLALAQLNREFERDRKRTPQLSDLRESGQIEADADFAGALYQPGNAPENPCDPREVRLRIMKQRDGSSCFDIPFTFIPAYTSFEDYTVHPFANINFPT